LAFVPEVANSWVDVMSHHRIFNTKIK